MNKFSEVVIPAAIVIAGAIGCIACSFNGNVDAAVGCLIIGCGAGFMTAAILNQEWVCGNTMALLISLV